MKKGLSTTQKLLITAAAFTAAIIGFMIKLPVLFRHHDKEMHALFYFLAAAFLNILFAQRRLIPHLIIFILLYLFGMGIEYAQEYSNHYFRSKIHGRYDPEDMLWNTRGLVAFSILWCLYAGTVFLFKQTGNKKTT